MKAKKNQSRKLLLKSLLIIPLGLGLAAAPVSVKAQEPPSKATPPPPPPSPGELLNKINPFKKKKTETPPKKDVDKNKKAETIQPTTPPPPPNPLNLFKKKKADKTKPASR